MTNILNLKTPLLGDTETLLTSIAATCHSLNIEFFVAGATAREVILHHVHGTKRGRRTRDIDIAVFVEHWSTFDSLKNHLTEQGAFTVAGNAHRLFWQKTEIDIIPFGDIAQDNKIAWPPEKAIVMSVDGFAEAFVHAVTVQLNNGTTVRFCSLPGLALLKLFAWRDRGRENKKDAADLYKIISDYGTIENERIYEPPINCDALDGDPKRMGASLLGHDMALMLTHSANQSTQRAVTVIDKIRLTDAIISQYTSDTPEEIEEIMDGFWEALQPEPNP